MARHCPECGFVVAEGANYCPKCGAFQGAPEPAKEDVTTATYVIDDQTGELKPVDVADAAAQSGALVIRSGGGRVAAGQDVGQALDVGARDDLLATLVLLAQPVDELRAEDVDLAVQDPAPVGHLLLLVRELLDEILQLLVRERPQIGEGVHHQSVPLLASVTTTPTLAVQAQLEGAARLNLTASRR